MNQCIIIYADGGARPITPGFTGGPGHAGWGIHGYIYNEEESNKSVPGVEQLITNIGYIPKDFVSEKEFIKVTPTHYIDGYGSLSGENTNNVAELCAAINALQYAGDYELKHVKIFTDSKYVCLGFTEYVGSWIENGWKKRDGNEPANISYWKNLIAERDKLAHRGIVVTIEWVKGHVEKNDDNSKHPYCLGNVFADKLATIGTQAAAIGRYETNINTCIADSYWKSNIVKHPFISNKRLYFNTIKEFVRSGEYYLGEHGKDDDLFGKKISDGAYSVVRLKEPDKMIEYIREQQIDISNNADAIIMVRLDQLFKQSTYDDIEKYGNLAFRRRNKYRLDIDCLDNEPLTREFNPPKLAIRAVEAISDIADKLDEFKNNNEKITSTDITEVIYDIESKTTKKGITTITYKLKPFLNVGFASLPISANYKHGEEIKQADIILTLGIDLVDRNTLKRLDSSKPKINLITWNESEEVFRYAVVIQTEQGDEGIWCGYYSNFYYLNTMMGNK